VRLPDVLPVRDPGTRQSSLQPGVLVHNGEAKEHGPGQARFLSRHGRLEGDPHQQGEKYNAMNNNDDHI